MAHAKPEHLKDLSVLLGELRKEASLREKSHGCFYFKSKSVLHFHIQGERRYAHVFDGKVWNEVDLKSDIPALKQVGLAKVILRTLPPRT